MVEKKLQELYNVYNIASEKSWNNILRAATEITDSGEELKIDFTGTNLQNPWEYNSFIELVNNPRVYMHFYNNPSIISHLKALAIINGATMKEIERRFTNETVEEQRRKTADEITAEKKGMELVKETIKTWKGVKPGTINGRLKLSDRYSQVTNVAAVSYIRWAIDYLIREKNLVSFEIDFRGIENFTSGVLKGFASVVYYFDKQIDIICTVDETSAYAQKLNEYLVYESTNGYTDEERVEVIKDDLVKFGGIDPNMKIISPSKEKPIYLNIPGLIAKYRTSKGKDDLGRCGSGEVVSNRVAILKYIYRRENKLYAVVHAYRDRSFLTSYEFVYDKPQDNNGYELNQIEVEKVTIEMGDLGYKDVYLGAKYHFLEPCQGADERLRTLVVGFDERGYNIKETCTTPMRMKRVFDSHNIAYNSELLELAIKKTDELIKSNRH